MNKMKIFSNLFSMMNENQFLFARLATGQAVLSSLSVGQCYESYQK